jgi:hypothetical protein
MKDVIFDDFQNSVNASLLRHRSVLDILTKLQESQARINRSVAKTITNCGCVKINSSAQPLAEDIDIDDIDEFKNFSTPQIEGEICDNCRQVIESEIGNNLFYLSSLCNLLDLNLYDIYLKEYDKMKTLGKFTLR